MKKNNTQFMLLGITTLVLLVSIGLYITRQMGHLKIDKSLTQVNKVTFLLHALGDDNDYYFSIWISLFPKEKRVGLYFVNPLSKFESETESLIKLKSGAPKIVENELESIFSGQVNYSITIHESEFKKIVNLAGGIPVFFDPKSIVESKQYNRPVGGFYNLDGEDSFDYLSTLEGKSALDYVRRLERQESFLLNFFHFVKMNSDSVKTPYLALLFQFLETDLNLDEFLTVSEFLLEEDVQFGVSELPGEIQGTEKKNEFILSIHSDTAKIAYKTFEADLLSEFFADPERARVEVLNGTNINGLARKGKSVLNERRIKVLSVDNAWSDDFPRSFVINRSGTSKITEKINEAIPSSQVFFGIRKELGLDATVVLGEDFGKSK